MTGIILAILIGQWLPVTAPGSGKFVGFPAEGSMTTAAMTLYVDPTGSNSGACTSTGTGACATIQGAVNKVPKRIRHAVNINVAAGSYSVGAYIEGFTFECGAGTTSAGCYLKLLGTFSNSTIATGLVTGTVASATAGSTTLGPAANKSIITVTAAGWTVSDLRNRFLVVTSNTGVVQTRPIYDNTATTATVESTWATTPTGTSTFAIMDAGSVITGGLTLPASQARTDLTGTVASTAISSYASFIVSANSGNSSPSVVPDTGGANTSDASVMIERFGFSGVTHALSVRHTGDTLFYNCQITGAITSTVGSALNYYDASLRAYGNVASNLQNNTPLVGGQVAANNSGKILVLRGNVITGGGLAAAEQNAASCMNAPGQFQFVENNIKSGSHNQALVSMCSGGSSGLAGIQGELYESNTASHCIVFRSASANSTATWGQINIIGGEFDNCVGDAIRLGGVSMSNSATVTSGTGSTGYGWHLMEGANAHIYQSSTLTGIGGNISLDGATAITYAQLNTNTSLRRLSQNVGAMNNTAELPAGIPLFDLIATAALPASSVANKGGCAWDTTLNLLTCSNGTAWSAYSAGANWERSSALASAFAAGTDVGTGTATKSSTLASANFTSQLAGVGAGTFQADLCNGAGACAVSFANIVVACTAAAGTVTAATVTTPAIPAATVLNWRITANACTTNVNALGQLTGVLTTP